MPALSRATIVILFATILGMPAALAQSERPGQWTDPPSRARTPSPGADGRGSGEPSAASPREAARPTAREAARARPAPTPRARTVAARTARRQIARRPVESRRAAIRTASAQRTRAALQPRLRSARLDRPRMMAARQSLRAEPARTHDATAVPAREPERVVAIGQRSVAMTARPRPPGHAIVRGRPEDDTGPIDLFDPDMARFDWCE